jgi:hypothetical protein
MNPKQNIWSEKPQRNVPTLPGGRLGAVPLMGTVEAVEKVPKQIPGRDAEKSDLTECATINDLMLGMGQRAFPTGSLAG